MHRILAALLSLFLATSLLLPSPAVAKEYLVTFTQIVEHPSLDAVRTGFKQRLAELGLTARYKDYIAQGSMDLAIQIASQMQGDNPDLVVAIATPTAQAALQKIKDKPILFTAITDPVAAGLVKDLAKPGANATGMTDKSPVDRQLALILELVPQAKKIGFLYNAGEANSVVSFEQAKAECAARGLTLVAKSVANSSEVYAAVKSLVGEVQAIHLPTDNTVITALESVLKVGAEHKIPVFTANTDSVERGAVAGVAVDYLKMGRQSADMAKRILVDGAKPADMPVETLKELQLYLNPKAAAAMGVSLPESLMQKADKVVK